ncbi:MAG: hypothetical protein IJ301_05005 [Clostridia bacterium]|nr:hypothetical protein [Clostridia bacterium]
MKKEDFIKKYSNRKYPAHFDRPISLEKMYNQIINPNYIIKHSFLPFLHFSQTYKKFSTTKKRYTKARELCYSGHKDRCIYQYYASILNELYNERVKKDNTNMSAIAYRTNLRKSNIHFANIAFNFIKKQEKCLIIVSDFKDFFGSLDHLYLKKQLCNLLNTTNLPDDFYKIFRNITKYSYINIEEILTYLNIPVTQNNIDKLKHKNQIMPIQKLRKDCKDLIHINKENYGIPQGSTISAVLSNIYMLELDKKIKDYTNQLDGLYFRYSDDILIVIPIENNSDINNHYNHINTQIQTTPMLTLHPDKTQIFIYENSKLNFAPPVPPQTNLILNYLGFSFDGENISIRPKTLSKYYHRAYKKVDNIRKNPFTKNGHRASGHNLYKLYTQKGANQNKSHGNFITYINRCCNVFKDEQHIKRIKNKHMGKIKRRLKNINI